MKRRDFLKSSSALALSFSTGNLMAAQEEKDKFLSDVIKDLFRSVDNKELPKKISKDEISTKEKTVFTNNQNDSSQIQPIDNLSELKSPKSIVTNDIFIEDKLIPEFISVRKKLTAVQRYVGYGNFNVISFDEMMRYTKQSSKLVEFTKKELDFLESIFYYDPKYHGFYGNRVSEKITQTINKREIIKIPRTGHYLFRGEPEKIYYQMVDDVGDSLTLTSGVRSIVKQSKLFLDKLASVDGNLSVASKSLAPPAFTYHSIADFDVGKKGFGHANFTPRFALTEEFLKMRKLKYIDMRYTINNKDGVRYEPWHVKVI